MSDTSKEEVKARRFTVEITEMPIVRESGDGRVVNFSVAAKAAFKGDITLKAKGDVASAYWSVTPGMKLSVLATETGDREYTAEQIDLLAATQP